MKPEIEKDFTILKSLYFKLNKEFDYGKIKVAITLIKGKVV
jgi:hypothetical protein